MFLRDLSARIPGIRRAPRSRACTESVRRAHPRSGQTRSERRCYAECGNRVRLRAGRAQAERAGQLTIVTVTHDAALARQAHRIVRLVEGRLTNAKLQPAGQSSPRTSEGTPRPGSRLRVLTSVLPLHVARATGSSPGTPTRPVPNEEHAATAEPASSPRKNSSKTTSDVRDSVLQRLERLEHVAGFADHCRASVAAGSPDSRGASNSPGSRGIAILAALAPSRLSARGPCGGFAARPPSSSGR